MSVSPFVDRESKFGIGVRAVSRRRCRRSNPGSSDGHSDVICHNSAISELRTTFGTGSRPTDRRWSFQFGESVRVRGRLKNVRSKGDGGGRGGDGVGRGRRFGLA